MFVKGLPVCPLRLTVRGRRELPVKVENMAGVEEKEAMAPRPDKGSDCAQWQRQRNRIRGRAGSGRPKQMLLEVKLTSIVAAESDDKVQGSSGRVGS